MALAVPIYNSQVYVPEGLPVLVADLALQPRTGMDLLVWLWPSTQGGYHQVRIAVTLN